MSGKDRTATSALSRSLGIMVIVSSPTPASLVANFISLAMALGASFTDQEYKARDSIWLDRKQRTGRDGGTNDKLLAIRSLAPALQQWTMPLNLDVGPKPAEAFVIGHLYEGVMLMCLTSQRFHHGRALEAMQRRHSPPVIGKPESVWEFYGLAMAAPVGCPLGTSRHVNEVPRLP